MRGTIIRISLCIALAALFIHAHPHAGEGGVAPTSGTTDPRTAASREFVEASHSLVRLYLRDEEPLKARKIYDALLELDDVVHDSAGILGVADSLVRHYCLLENKPEALDVFMSTYNLDDTSQVVEKRDEIRRYLKEQGIQEAPDTIRF